MDQTLSLLVGPTAIVLLGALALAVAPLLHRQETRLRTILHSHQRRVALAYQRLAAPDT